MLTGQEEQNQEIWWFPPSMVSLPIVAYFPRAIKLKAIHNVNKIMKLKLAMYNQSLDTHA